jgi:DNA-binding FadR family transcriptional regulator
MSTLSQRVVAGLKDKILAGELPAGAKLPSEAELLEEYAVSRTVVREAVTRLRAEGLVETQQGRGSFVLAVPEPSSFTVESSAIRTQRDVLAMVDFRLGIESEAAALAAAHRDHDDEAALSAALASFTDVGQEGAVEADFTFHLAIARATHNRFYVDLLDSLGPMMILLPRTRLGSDHSMTDAGHVERVQREHENIAAAVVAGDADTARSAMRVHLGNTRRRVRAGQP